MTLLDCYDKLGVAKDATFDQVKQAFRKKAMQYHPDVNDSEDAVDLFRELYLAYETIEQYLKFKDKYYDTLEKQFETDVENIRTRRTGNEDLQERIRRAQEKLRKRKEREENMFQTLFDEYVNGWRIQYVRVLAVICSLISVFILVDAFGTAFEEKKHVHVSDENIVSAEDMYSRMTQYYITIDGHDYSVGLPGYQMAQMFDTVLLIRTKYFKQVKAIEFYASGYSQRIKPHDIYMDSVIVLAMILLLPLISFFVMRPNFGFTVFLVRFNIYAIPIILLYLFLGDMRVVKLCEALF